MPIPESLFEIPRLVCPAPSCGKELRYELDRMGSSKVTGATYYCDTCKYGFVPSLPKANGTTVGVKYVPPEVVEPKREAFTGAGHFGHLEIANGIVIAAGSGRMDQRSVESPRSEAPTT